MDIFNYNYLFLKRPFPLKKYSRLKQFNNFRDAKSSKTHDNRGERVKLNSKIVIVGEALFAYKHQHYTLGWSAPRRTYLFLVSKTFHRGYAVQAYLPCIRHWPNTSCLTIYLHLCLLYRIISQFKQNDYSQPSIHQYLEYLNNFLITIKQFFLLNKLVML